ncbi:uncharacterized protein LOC129743232 [Uranotaenia lowii]|uniref:uncharacterized protein LOC129743232 n=1 Tax=Uranotaenia lowii TaxID=190385 RepID=UPI002479A460|nr:uncharacterized protein LOC129743232 [Uranotaenia lowii]
MISTIYTDLSAAFDKCTIFYAEAAAAYIPGVTPADRPITVLFDSASVVTALQSETVSHPCLQQLQLKAAPDTTFVWIPGHCGITGNEEADRLAKSGRRQARLTNSVPAADLKSSVTKAIANKWAEDWLNCDREGTREYFLRKIKGDTFQWEDPLAHQEQQILSRLRTGHTSFAYNLHGGENFKIQCTACRVHQSVEHVLCHCPQFDGVRNQHEIPVTIKDALGNEPTVIAAVMLFLKDIGLYDQT